MNEYIKLYSHCFTVKIEISVKLKRLFSFKNSVTPVDGLCLILKLGSNAMNRAELQW